MYRLTQLDLAIEISWLINDDLRQVWQDRLLVQMVFRCPGVHDNQTNYSVFLSLCLLDLCLCLYACLSFLRSICMSVFRSLYMHVCITFCLYSCVFLSMFLCLFVFMHDNLFLLPTNIVGSVTTLWILMFICLMVRRSAILCRQGACLPQCAFYYPPLYQYPSVFIYIYIYDRLYIFFT